VSERSVWEDQPLELAAKSSFDNRSRDFPNIFEDDEDADVTFGR
jgi:hypothetical protein